ncbi:hypothetical protein ABRY23_13195 [Melioribacteraceae bacterium 4301-Me]|uniref:hypothetical protein n=1 Tax=Pyranulibacter aquaticus TaxID=3163344 RepID=UPI003598445C
MEVRIFGKESFDIDLTAISPVYGWAWAGVSSTPISNSHSVGWIKFSSDTTSTDKSLIIEGAQKYGVYLNRNTKELMGYAWSGIPCSQGSKEVCGYGWISFNKTDLIDSNGSFMDPPKINNNKLIGNIRFFSFFDSSNTSWDGFVNLGLGNIDYNTSTGVLSGSTNEVSVVPKIYFCDPNNPDNPIYCVYVSSTTYPAQTPKAKIEKPRNVTARPNPCSNGSCSITVSWTNPQDYSEVKIMMFNIDEANNRNAPNAFNRCKTESNVTRCWRDVTIYAENLNVDQKTIQSSGNQIWKIKKLEPNTKYLLLIRGIVKQ